MKSLTIFKSTARHRPWWLAAANIVAMLFAIIFQMTSGNVGAATSTSTASTCTVAPCIGWVAYNIVGVRPTQNEACEATYTYRKATATSPGLNFYAWEVVPRSSGNLCFIRGVQGNADATVIYPLSEYKYPEAPSLAQDAPESCPVGNPTFPGSGTKTHMEHVYEASFANPLRFDFKYRSRSDAIVQTAGWSSTYSRRIAVFGNAIVVIDDDGGARVHNDIGKPNEWRSADAQNVVNQTFDSAGQKTGWIAQNFKDDSVETYNTEGQLLSIKQRNGWVTSMQYGTNRKLVSVTNQFGRRLVFGYDSAGRMSSLTTPQGAITRYGYDSAGNLTSITWPDGNIKRFHYEDSRFARALTGVTDESGRRIGTYTYDAQGRIAETKRADGADRFQFSYANGPLGPRTQVTDFSSGTAASRTYDFIAQGQFLRPAAVSAPCAQCGTTALSTQYDAQGNKTREVAHDGTITFYAYNAKGQEIERATFSAQYKTSSTRPALGLAIAVTSTWWGTAWNLPTHVAQPGRYSTYTYNANGMLTGHSTVVTTDATGAAKFSPVKSGPVRATSYGYDANNFNTSVVELIDSVENQRWTLAYDTLGGLTGITDVTGAQSASITQNNADGRVLSGATDQGVPIAIAYSPRGSISQITRGTQTARFTYNTMGTLIQVRTPDNQVIDYVVDASQTLVDIKLNGASVSSQMLALGKYPDSAFKGQIELAKQALIRSVEGLLRSAHAQVVVVGGGWRPASPVYDPRSDMMMSPISGPDEAIRVIQEAIARACRCDPNRGFAAPKFTTVTFAHVFGAGHVIPMFSDKSTFASTEKVGQTLVDEVITRATGKTTKDTRDVYSVDMGRIVGMRYDRASTSSDKRVPTQWITMIVERSNCSSIWRANEVVTLYPDKERR